VSKKRRPKSSTKAAERPEPPDGLSVKQAVALDALSEGQSTAQAALAAGVSDRTVRRWGREPQFHTALLERRREPVKQAVGLTQRYAPAAVGALLKVLNDPAAPASAKVTAATTVLKFAVEGVQLDDLALRIEALERNDGGRPVGLALAPAPPLGDQDAGDVGEQEAA
jgi:hypothetical protein